MAVQPLQLPQLINVPQLNFSGLDAIGDTIAGYRQRAALADALPGMLGQQPAQPQGNSLATLGQPQQPTAAPGNANSAIGGIESGGNYGAVGPATRAGDRAYGKYQVMGANIPEWTKEVLGRSLTPQEFLASPQAQDAVFNAKFGQYAQKYGPEGAARAWFAGEGGMNDLGRKDQLGTTVGDYGKKFALAFNGENPPLPSAVTQGAQAAMSQPGGAGMQPPAATPSQQQAPQTVSGQTIPPDTMARIQAMIRAGGPAQQFAMALLQKYVVPQQPVVINEGGVAVNPVTGQVIARGQPKSYAVQAGGELVTPGAPGASPGASGATVYQNTSGKLSDDALTNYANIYLKTGQKPDLGNGAIGAVNRAEFGNKLAGIMAQRGFSADDIAKAQADFGMQKQATEAFGTGQQGNTVRSLNVAVDHLALLRELALEMSNGAGISGFRPSNALVNAFKKEFGSDLPTNVEAAKHIVAAEIAKAVTGSNGALGDREELAAPLQTANSWQQLSGVIDKAYTPLMAGQLRGLRQQFVNSTKKTEADFNNLLSERTKAALSGEQAGPKIQKVTSSADANAAIAAAKQAIAQGADPKAVNARLQQMGVPPLAGQ